MGEAVPDGAVLLGTVAGSAASASVDLTALGLAVGEGADIAVVTVDQALNESVVGEVGCVTREETMGFCDEYGQCESCSIAEAGFGRGSLAGGLAVLLAALALTRRRRNR
jgi:MYXO-CTERM domain-containing protein